MARPLSYQEAGHNMVCTCLKLMYIDIMLKIIMLCKNRGCVIMLTRLDSTFRPLKIDDLKLGPGGVDFFGDKMMVEMWRFKHDTAVCGVICYLFSCEQSLPNQLRSL